GFDFCRFETGGKDETASFRWVYSIPLSFYHCLHRQVKALFFGAIVILVLISLIPGDINMFEWMAAPGLLCGSFACWIGIYVGVLYIDYALLRKKIFSIRALLLVLFLCSSYFNNDHPVRYNNEPAKPRIAFKRHFEAWFTEYKKEMDRDAQFYQRKGKYPVVFICAEGGALRTGAYTAIFLDKLQDTLASHNINFKRAVYAMSGVSGGSLGLGYYNATNFINKPADFNKDFGEDTTAAQRFFIHDFLSPVIGKMFYGDLLNLFIPFHINRLDRAIGLEQSWEYAYKTLLKDKTQNTFAGNFLAPYDTATKSPLPLLMINTTEVESGNQAWVTNVTPGNIIFAESRDLLGGKISKGLNYSTAINFSSRFPLFSPGGMLSGTKTVKKASGKDTTFGWKLHYIDGGYYENTGAGSMLELLTQIKHSPLGRQIYPVVIYLRFSDNPADKNSTINFGNELSEVISGIYNTRSGRSTMAVQQLNELSQRFLNRSFTGTYIDEPLTENQRQVPMNWVLSRQSMSNIKRNVNAKLKDSSGRAALPIILNCKYDFPKINPTLESAPKTQRKAY
ncbi:MAG TPA: patatin-like phospholipase family protein, partial [Mucilaginibacter sp.]